MQIVRNDPSGFAPNTAPIMRGEVLSRAIVGTTESEQVRVGHVKFVSGARNVWHKHTFDQVLIVTEGEGIVATEGNEVHVKTGDVAIIPAGEKHWHGATPTTTMAHLTVSRPGTTEIIGE
ncbi:MAG TPA: cupin domain-containing protein [Dehalococcoidia bacterium]|nr:cupin domain-containing protein [Dehalococcoidia bacterium]